MKWLGIHFCTQRKPVEFSEFNRLSIKWVWNILLKLEAAKSDNEQ